MGRADGARRGQGDVPSEGERPAEQGRGFD